MNDSYGTRSLREIVRILFEHWLMLLFIVLVGTGGTYVVCSNMIPRYQSKVSLMFKRPVEKTPISADAGDKALEVFVKAQQQIVMSDLVLARAMVVSRDKQIRDDWLRLRNRWEKASGEGGTGAVAAQEEISRMLEKSLESKVSVILNDKQKELKEFRDAIKLETPGGEQVALTESFTLSITQPGAINESQSYKNAMYAADALADMYIVRYQELQRTLSNPAVRVMQEVINKFKEERKEDFDVYETFVREHSADIGILEQLLKSGTEHGTQVVLTKAREEDARLVMELERDIAIFQVMKAVLPEKAFAAGGIEEMNPAALENAITKVSIEFLRNNVGFEERIKEVARLEARKAKVQSQYTPESRELQYVSEQLFQAQRQLLQAIVAHAQGLEAGIRARQQQREKYGTLITSIANEQNKTQAELARYAELKNNFLTAQKQLEELERNRLEAMANWLRARDAVTITKLDQASMPNVDQPTAPKTPLYTIVAFVVSALIGTAGAFMIDHFDHTLRSAVEAERYLGVPVLGSVKKRGNRLIVGT